MRMGRRGCGGGRTRGDEGSGRTEVGRCQTLSDSSPARTALTLSGRSRGLRSLARSRSSSASGMACLVGERESMTRLFLSIQIWPRGD